MSKPWGGLGGAGAWALDAERAEEEEREAAAAPPAPAAPAGFPSLREAAAGAGAGKSKKKSKGTTLSLSEFAGYGPGRRQAAAPAPEPRGLTPAEMMMLPTGPRERSADELDRSGGLGGGFRSYGGGERRGGGFDDDGRRGPPGRGSDLDMPSRADEDRDWSMSKKSSAPSPTDSGPRSRYGSLGGGSPTSVGRADDDGDWSRGKKPLASGPSRYSSLGSGGGGGGFRDSPGSTDSDRWSRAPPTNGERERPRIVLDPPKRDASTTATPPAEAGRSRPSPFGAARPRENVLAEKGLDWRKMETEIDQKKTSRPTSSQSSRPGSEHSSRPGSPGSQVSAVGSDGAPRARPKVNPFGDAKPRELVLQEKGKDWRKIDLELERRRIDRPEANEERVLKEEINLLKVELSENEAKISDDDARSLSEKIAQLEKQLDLLTIELDDNIRFAQRPGSGAGRVTASPPTSLVDESQITESMERSRPRSTVEQYPRPTEERWGFQGSRDRGSFGGNRSSDRSSTGQRW
ncbi:hypothetical protein ACP4OV_006313 [Aristida adscensionis]